MLQIAGNLFKIGRYLHGGRCLRTKVLRHVGKDEKAAGFGMLHRAAEVSGDGK
jgi:hypothetical protein